ncbi:hypothetical protein [Streptomyces chartreusis]
MTRWEDARLVLGSPSFSTDPTLPGAPNLREGEQRSPRGFFQQYDDPIHAVMRRTLTREFMVKRVDALRPGIARLTDELLTELTKRQGPVDLVEHLSLPLPSLVICELLGVPYEDHAFFQQLPRPSSTANCPSPGDLVTHPHPLMSPAARKNRHACRSRCRQVCRLGPVRAARPEVFDQRDEDGMVVVLDENPPNELHDTVGESAANCSAAAIRLAESS